MKTILGLVLELNPFHNGHKYFIDEAKKKVNPDITVAIFSTNFSMRGDIMVLNKFDKARIALEMGIDIVLELPFLGAVASADYFAYNAVQSLCDFGITDLAFGVELNNLEKLHQMKNLLLMDAYNEQVKIHLDLGNSFSTSTLKAASMVTSDKEIIKGFSLPNNTLAIQYLVAIEKINPTVKVTLIQRIHNDYYDKHTTGPISSATSLRLLLQETKDITPYIPQYQASFTNLSKGYDILYQVLTYKLSIENLDCIKNMLGVNEGIENRLFSMLTQTNDYDSFIKAIQTKRYPFNRIKRLLLHILLETPKEFSNKYFHYLRILAMNSLGKQYVSRLNKDIKKQIITNIKHHLDDVNIVYELKATKLFGLLTNNPKLYLEEFKMPIIGE
jgi:predicted nucleotidyltransferase